MLEATESTMLFTSMVYLSLSMLNKNIVWVSSTCFQVKAHTLKHTFVSILSLEGGQTFLISFYDQ